MLSLLCSGISYFINSGKITGETADFLLDSKRRICDVI